MIEIVDFTGEHIEKAKRIAVHNYEVERLHAAALPPVAEFPDLTPFAKNGFGVAALEDGEMSGFLCSYSPFANSFGSTDAIGVYSPMHANGTVPANRARLYALMYQAAAKKWAEAGASSHGICLYAHDKEAHEQLFQYGFGLRCVDAIKHMEEINAPTCSEYEYAELLPEEYSKLLPLEHMLSAHMADSPTFILRQADTAKGFIENARQNKSRFFSAKANGEVIAFIKIENEGETFICKTPGMKSIVGAFCLPRYRGSGVYQNLLNFMIRTLKAEGYSRLGVDFESFNPTANGFWLKYFTAYTYSVVRRIDEHALKARD